MLTLAVMAVVSDLLRAIAEYRFRIKNGISWGTFWFQKCESEKVDVVGSLFQMLSAATENAH